MVLDYILGWMLRLWVSSHNAITKKSFSRKLYINYVEFGIILD